MNKISNKSNYLKNIFNFDELEIYYQPIINKETLHVSSLEALIRWNNKKTGFILPKDFVTESETNGSIIEIGEWIIKEACKKASKLNENGLLTGYVSVNISPVQLFKGNLHLIILEALKESNLPPNKLQIEIKESFFISNVKKTLELIKKIEENGIRLAIDNFGEGYFSLKHLSKFKINAVKINKRLIKDIKTKDLIKISKDMKSDLIIMGIEEKEDTCLISEIEYTHIQGFYYSKPLVFKDVEKLLKSNDIKIKMKLN